MYPLLHAAIWYIRRSYVSHNDNVFNRFFLVLAMILTGLPDRLDMLRSSILAQCQISADGDWLLMDYWV